MTLDDLIKQKDGKFVEVGGSSAALNQCVDLANLYRRDVLGLPIILGADADMFPSMCMNDMDWYPYQGQYPEKGDLIIWDMGNYGHIAIATGVRNGAKFQTFSQNYPLKSPAHLVDFSLASNIIGYLRPKGDKMPFSDNEMSGGIDAVIHDFLGEQQTPEQINGHLMAMKKRQEDGNDYCVSEFIHDRYKEFEKKEDEKIYSIVADHNKEVDRITKNHKTERVKLNTEIDRVTKLEKECQDKLKGCSTTTVEVIKIFEVEKVKEFFGKIIKLLKGEK